MAFVAIEFGTCSGCDTNSKMSGIACSRLSKATLPNGQPASFILRYVSLGFPSIADITELERDAILEAGFMLGLVQHVQNPSWIANAANGIAHGKAAVTHAQLVEYPKTCHLALDMEGLGDPGPLSIAYIRAWAQIVHAAGYKVCVYVGYDAGASATDLAALVSDGTIDLLWKDYGARQAAPGVGWGLEQHSQTTVAGTVIDPDDSHPDQRGVCFVGMGLADVNTPDNGDPAAVNVQSHV